MELRDTNVLSRAIKLTWYNVAGYFIFMYLRRTYRNRFIKKGLSQFKDFVFERILNQSVSDFDDNASGKYISAFSNDLNQIEINYLNGSFTIIAELLLFVASLAAMLYINPRLAVWVLLSSTIPAVLSIRAGNRMVEKEKDASNQNQDFVGQVSDLLNGFLVIKSFKAEKEVLELFKKRNLQLEDTKKKRQETADTVSLMSGVSSIIGTMVVFTFGTYYVFTNIMTIGSVFAFMELQNYVFYPMQKLVPLLSNRKASAALIRKLADAAENRSEAKATEPLEAFTDAITLRDVSYSYDTSSEVLKHINLRFEKGRSYAIVGASGSGKSTLLKLLLGHVHNYTGSITYDDMDLRAISMESLYDMISLIDQNVFLFDKCIEDNITMFKDFPEERVQKAINLAGLSDLIREKGRDYPCGAGGSNLSGGEKQRISIARCLVRDTPILLVDEATSALDNAAAYEVSNSILGLENLTRIVVTHKLEKSLMEKYNSIIVLRHGTIAEQGTFTDLMWSKGYFYSLFNVEQAG